MTMTKTSKKREEEIIMTMIKTRKYYEVCCDGEIFDTFDNEDDAVEYADKMFNDNKDDFAPDDCIHVYFVEEWFDVVDNRWRRNTEDIIHTAMREE